MGKEPLGLNATVYILGDLALLGDYRGFNWQLKESKVLNDFSGRDCRSQQGGALPSLPAKKNKSLVRV